MPFVYMLFNSVGYFLFMILFFLVAFLLAKWKFSWVFYGIGAVLQLVSLIGTTETASLFGVSSYVVVYWVIYVALMIVGAFVIHKRYKAYQRLAYFKRMEATDASDELPTDSGKWICTCCGTANDISRDCCETCNKYHKS